MANAETVCFITTPGTIPHSVSRSCTHSFVSPLSRDIVLVPVHRGRAACHSWAPVRSHTPLFIEDTNDFEVDFNGSNTGEDELSAPWKSESPTDAQTSADPLYESSGGSGVGGLSGGSGGSGSGRGEGSDGEDGNESEDSLPEDMKAALAYGSLSTGAIQRYFKALKTPFLRFLLTFPAFRSRFLMDASFLFKLLVQELIGNGTALAGEIVVRGKEIFHELEYVTSDLMVGTVIEAAFVWLLAPTLSLPNASNASVLSKYIAALPSNLFQPSTAVQTFTLSQRLVSFLYAGGQYAFIGFVGGVVGTAITYALIETRKLLDKDYKPMRPQPAVIPNSVGWAAFMAFSSNTRFQIVEGMELGIARLFAGSSASLVNSGIVVLRFLNNYWGGVQFVQFFRAIGLHATDHKTD